ncbi:MAG: hypothetical protein LBF68_08480 [Christensenellaceae bacterium]|jgi:type I restriction enzyme M protein|nr:hypothetical protein [Christensenellaceae bacterium]
MLSVTNIENILKLVKDRKNVEYKSKVISFCDIGNFDLSVNAYVKRKDNDNRVNITELNTEIKLIVKRQSALREQFDKIIREIENEEK